MWHLSIQPSDAPSSISNCFSAVGDGGSDENTSLYPETISHPCSAYASVH